MLKRFGTILTLMLIMPAFAHAWTISARVAAGSGNVYNGATPLLPTPGYISLANTVPSQDLTVTPAVGSTISSVLVDGRTATPVSPGVYRVNYNSTSSHSITAYFKVGNFTVTSTQAPNGLFTIQQTSPTTTAPTTGNLDVVAGSTISVVATPMGGYSVTSINIGGIVTPGATATATINAATTVTATYALVPAISVSSFTTTLPSILMDTVGVTMAATAAGNDATGAKFDFVVKNASDATVGSTANDVDGVWKTATLPAGDYTATVTAKGPNGAINTKSINFTVLNALDYTTNACTGCHSNSTPSIVNAFMATKHAESTSHDSAKCFRCHNGKGYLFAENTAYTGDATFINMTAGKVPNLAANAPIPISCAVCHTDAPHNGGSAALRPIAGWDPNGNGRLDQFDVCTSCHTLQNTAGKLNHYHAAGSSLKLARIISDTHYDDPATAAGQGNENGTTIINKVEGYVVRINGANPCADCHDLHMSEIQSPVAGESTIQQQWARSGHAGKILKVKEDFVFANFSTNHIDADLTKTADRTIANIDLVSSRYASDAVAQAWTHYNWDQTTGIGNRATCQKCHTATGAANYLSNPVTYNTANNDFSHLSGWTAATGSPQNEVLYCWGCHTSAATGAIRNPGAVTADYNFKGVKAVFPDVQASNTCNVCHSGQASGESITALTTAGNNFSNVSFVNSHYMAASALVYAKIGYINFIDPNTAIGTSTYGKSLTSDADGGSLTSTHRKLGTPAMATDSHVGGQGMISGGPCVTCHYAKGEHELEMNATAFNEVCVKCHTAEGSTTLTADNFKELFIEEQAVPFQDALALALNQLSTKYHITYNPAAYPYFYDADAGNVAVKNWTRSGTLTAAQAEKLMGACFNINVLTRDPAAYVHARTYARRLLYDTIDFLDDKTINMSTGATAIASDPVKYVKDTTAGGLTTESFKYLAGYNRTSLVWNALERP